MKLFFDTEFTGLRKTTTLISLGIVAEDGRRFYAEFTDYDEKQCDDWIKENVTSELLHLKPEIWESGVADRQIFGTRKEVAYALKDWLQQFEEIQFVSDVCHYDFVLLIDLFGTAFDLPKNVSPVCYDINRDIALYYGITEEEAFRKSRDEILLELYVSKMPGKVHNSLYDALVIKAIYDGYNETRKRVKALILGENAREIMGDCSKLPITQTVMDDTQDGNMFIRHKLTDGYSILEEKGTGICYLEYDFDNQYALSVMLNPDGTPRTWGEMEKQDEIQN